MGAMGGMTDEQLAAGWQKAEDAGDFDKADEYEHEFFRRMWSHPDWTNAAAGMHDKRLKQWRALTSSAEQR